MAATGLLVTTAVQPSTSPWRPTRSTPTGALSGSQRVTTSTPSRAAERRRPRIAAW